MTESESVALKPFYVYELRDPRNNEVFYVGKGTNRRAAQHEKEVVRKQVLTNNKLSRIKEIHDGGKEVAVVVVGRFDSEDEAFAVEAVLLKWVYGLTGLSNQIQGHRHRHVRSKGNFSEINGIDVPRKDYSRTGEFKAGIIRQIEQNYVMEDLEALRQSLIEKLPGTAIDEPAIVSAQSPCIVMHYNTDICLQLILSPTGNKRVVMNLIPCQLREESKRRFRDVCSAAGLTPRAGGKYAKLESWQLPLPKVDELPMILLRLQEAKRELESAGQLAAY